ncbi:questin oxidase family protein [Streptomyces xanthophaeus]
MDTKGTLDEALERLHTYGPERLGRLTNHAPMAVEALAARGHGGSVHRWIDRYTGKLEDFPSRHSPVTDDNWRSALGDQRRIGDWIVYFTGDPTGQLPWRDVLALWWPRLLPGLYGGSTHPVIRVGHAVRSLLADGESAPRRAELSHALGYWAARYRPLRPLVPLPGGRSAAQALEAVPPIDDRRGSFTDRLERVTQLPVWQGQETLRQGDPDAARHRLEELVRGATHRYATHGHGEETMLVHAATAPNAVLRTLPALPRETWAPSLRAAWTASAAVTSMYAPDRPRLYVTPGRITPEEAFARATDHGDEHVIKLADTALDVGDEQAVASVLRAIELTEVPA